MACVYKQGWCLQTGMRGVGGGGGEGGGGGRGLEGLEVLDLCLETCHPPPLNTTSFADVGENAGMYDVFLRLVCMSLCFCGQVV